MDVFEMNPAQGVYSPKRKSGKGIPLSESAQAARALLRMRKEEIPESVQAARALLRMRKEADRKARAKARAKAKRDARESVQVARAARRMRKEMRDVSKAKQQRIEEMRRLGMSLTASPGLAVYDADLKARTAALKARAKARAKAKRDARESVQAARAARRMRKEFRDESVQAARAAKRKIEEMRRLGMSLTKSPGLVKYDAAFRAKRQKAAENALARRMKDPAFAERYKRKMHGRKFRAGGRFLGQKYKTPADKRKGAMTSRVQRGEGLKKYVMRMGDWASKASLMDYAQMMRDKARAAYVKRKRALGKGSTVRTPLTASKKRSKRRAAYKRKKELTNLPQYVVNNTRMSPVDNLGGDIKVDDLSAMFDAISPKPKPRRTASVPSERQLRSGGPAGVRRSKRPRSQVNRFQ